MTALAYETSGDPRAPAIMLLHGFMSSNAQWLPNREALGRDHRLVLVELWGHGRSPLPATPDAFSLDTYLAEFERIRAELGIDRWALIGQSYGAGLTIQYARRYPDRCRALIVTNSRSALGAMERRNAEDEAAAAAADPMDTPEFSPRTLPYHPIHARRFPDIVKQALVAAADAMTVDAVRHGGRLGARLNCIDALADLEVPLLLTNGVWEKSFQADVQRLRALYPWLEVADLEGGHSINIEAAAAFDAACLDFLGRCLS